MNYLLAISMVWIWGMVWMPVALAQDVDDIKAAEHAHFVAISAGDVDAVLQHHHPQKTDFAVNGGLLNRFDSIEEQKKNQQAAIDAGGKLDVQLRHLEVKLYGFTAVTTGYLVGTFTSPDGTTQQVAGRRTAVLIKQDGQWKEVHSHNSPLITPSPQ